MTEAALVYLLNAYGTDVRVVDRDRDGVPGHGRYYCACRLQLLDGTSERAHGASDVSWRDALDRMLEAPNLAMFGEVRAMLAEVAVIERRMRRIGRVVEEMRERSYVCSEADLAELAEYARQATDSTIDRLPDNEIPEAPAPTVTITAEPPDGGA